VAKTRDQLQRMMIEGAGVVRSAESLHVARETLEAIAAATGSGTPVDRGHGELANLITVARSVLSSAALRCETRGAHARSDHPQASDRWRRRIVDLGDRVMVLRSPTRDPYPDRRPETESPAR
jgi:L-aspartate oxidase